MQRNSIRQVDDGIVLRLYSTIEWAQAEASLMNSSTTIPSDFETHAHPSGNGFVLRCRKTGRLHDAAGIVDGVFIPQ